MVTTGHSLRHLAYYWAACRGLPSPRAWPVHLHRAAPARFLEAPQPRFFVLIPPTSLQWRAVEVAMGPPPVVELHGRHHKRLRMGEAPTQARARPFMALVTLAIKARKLGFQLLVLKARVSSSQAMEVGGIPLYWDSALLYLQVQAPLSGLAQEALAANLMARVVVVVVVGTMAAAVVAADLAVAAAQVSYTPQSRCLHRLHRPSPICHRGRAWRVSLI